MNARAFHVSIFRPDREMAGYLRPARDPGAAQQPYGGGLSAEGAISANAYSSGTDQNNGNVMTGRSTTRRLAPPGSVLLLDRLERRGEGGSEEGIVRGQEDQPPGASRADRHRGRPHWRWHGRGTAHMLPSVQLPERKHELIGYQKPEITDLDGRRVTTHSVGAGEGPGSALLGRRS